MNPNYWTAHKSIHTWKENSESCENFVYFHTNIKPSVQRSGRITFYMQRQKWTPLITSNFSHVTTALSETNMRYCSKINLGHRTRKIEELKTDNTSADKNTTKEHWIKFWKNSHFLSATRITFTDTNTEYWICFYMNEFHVIQEVLIAKQRYKNNSSIA